MTVATPLMRRAAASTSSNVTVALPMASIAPSAREIGGIDWVRAARVAHASTASAI